MLKLMNLFFIVIGFILLTEVCKSKSRDVSPIAECIVLQIFRCSSIIVLYMHMLLCYYTGATLKQTSFDIVPQNTAKIQIALLVEVV